MGDKRSMDNKVIKNPLLSNVDQNYFLEELVQNPLLVPAAPPKLSETTVDAAKGNQDKNVEKPFLIGHIKQETRVAAAASISSSGAVAEKSCEINPQITQTKQTFSEPPLIKPSVLTEISLDRSSAFTSTAATSLPLSQNKSTPPPNFSGPPPLTSYNRPVNKFPTSRYPTSSFLQTVPSAQYFSSQSNPNTPSISPSVSSHNFQKSSSSSPITFFVPQQQQQPPTQSPGLDNISKSSSASSFTSETTHALNTSISTNPNNYKTFSPSQSNINNTSPTKSNNIPQKQISVTQSHGINHTQSQTNQSIYNPAKVSPPSVPLTSVHNTVPSLPVSQSIIISSSPALISCDSDPPQQSEGIFDKTCETYFSSDGFKNVLLDKESFRSVYQPTSDSSSVLRSRSPSPHPTSIAQLQGSSVSTVSIPAVIQPSVSVSCISSADVIQLTTAVVTPSSEVIIQSLSSSVSPNIVSSLDSNNLVSVTETTSVSTLKQSGPSHLGSDRSSVTESTLNTNPTQTHLSSPLVVASPSATSSVPANVPALAPISSALPSSITSVESNPYYTSPVEITSLASPVAPLVSTTLSQPSPSCVAVSECSTFFQPIAAPVITESTTNLLKTQPLHNSDTSSSAVNINYKAPSNFFSSDTSFPAGEIFLDNSSSVQLLANSSLSKTPISGNSNLNKSPPPTSVPGEVSQTAWTPKTKEENSDVSSPVNIQAKVPLTSTSTTSLPQSLSHPPLFTFNPSTPLNDLGPLSQPPKQPYVQSAPISSSKHYPQSSTLPTDTFSNSSLFVGAGTQEIPLSAEFPAQSVFPTDPISIPPLLDPSKFFTASLPSLSDQFIDKSPIESNITSKSPLLQDANPSQVPPSSSFTSLNQSSPATLPTLQTYAQFPSPTSQPPTVNKPTTLQNNFPSTLPPTSTSPTLTSSHTPPPPYSSLFNKTETQTGRREQLTSISTHVPSSESAANPQVVGSVKEEELDQIPLDGNTIPLYNPQSLGSLSQTTASATKGGICNTYRLGSGLKRPVYAPVPDLGITHQVSQFLPTMSGPPPLQPATTTSPTTVSSPSVTRSSSVASSPPSEPATFNYNAQGQVYRPAYHHWFYKKGGESKSIWQPFSMADSLNLEQVFTSPELSENTKVATDGGRYDVEIMHRRKVPVYWEEPPGEVRRCSWFVRAPIESRYIPYDENIAEILEDAFKTGCIKNEWNRRVELADGEVIILHSPNAIAHHQRSSSPDAWGNPPTMQQKPRIVKRGLEDFEISEGEPNQVDHLLLMVHGIGKVCDLRFRSLVQVVDDFRNVSLQLIQSHFRSGTENGNVGRVEVLPVEWHRALHTEIIDKRLADITLPSIPKAREFTNDVLLDILFYTSPVFCERIVQAVGAEINRVYNLYMSRNPGFRGGVSLGGHSLGSLILFDMLCHQKPHRSMKSAFSPQSSIHEGDEDMPEFGCLKAKARLSRRMSYLTIGSAGTGQPYIIYPQLYFQPKAFFALGSPIGMFLTVRGIEGLGEDFKFPTCPKFFNIFHPNDPVAYRIEALVSPQMIGVPAVVIPHHKGRKRMHLELKDTMAHVTAALKQKLIDSMRSTWNTVYQLALFHRPDSSLQQEVDKVIENEILTNNDCANESVSANHLMLTEDEALDLKVGNLNGGDRIDYVLQEAPLETFNQYISAVRSHVVYWESEDTMLLILKELYATMGISPDCQVPQPILPFDISLDTSKETYSEYTDSIGAPPTQFIRK